MTPIADSVHETVSAATRKGMRGLAFVQGLANGTLPLNTIARTRGYDVIEASNGRVTIVAKSNDILLNPAGTMQGGVSTTLHDSRTGPAIQSTLKKHIVPTTIEFKTSLVRPITTGTGEIRAEGAVLSRGRRIATAKKKMTDRNRRVLTHGTANCLTFEH